MSIDKTLLLPDLMIDLETLGTGPKAAIISIGALRFNRNGRMLPEPGGAATFYRVIRLAGDIGKIDPETVLWWMQQSEKARSALFSTEAQASAQGLDIALNFFSPWLNVNSYHNPIERVWSKGPLFDERILREHLGYLFPVTFRASRDVRTALDDAEQLWGQEAGRILTAAEGSRIPAGAVRVAHHALSDCYRQAAHVQAIYQAKDRRAGL